MGRHNLENTLACIAAADSIGIAPTAMAAAQIGRAAAPPDKPTARPRSRMQSRRSRCLCFVGRSGAGGAADHAVAVGGGGAPEARTLHKPKPLGGRLRRLDAPA